METQCEYNIPETTASPRIYISMNSLQNSRKRFEKLTAGEV